MLDVFFFIDFMAFKEFVDTEAFSQCSISYHMKSYPDTYVKYNVILKILKSASLIVVVSQI